MQVLDTPLFFIKASFGSSGEEMGVLFTAKYFIPRMEQVGPMQVPLKTGAKGTIMLQPHLMENCGLPAEAAMVQICGMIF